MKLLRILLVVGAITGAMLSAKPSHAGEDTTPPVCAITGSSPETFYPKEDGYRDQARITYDVSDDSVPFEVNVQLMVLIPDAGGELAYTGPVATVANPSFGLELRWDGRDSEGVLVPEGPYDLMVHTSDGNGNIEDCHQAFTVDHAELTRLTYKQSITVHGSQLGKVVGDCSVLRKPSLRDWVGSAGYYSNKRCSQGFDASVVGTGNGILVPEAFRNRYHSLTVKLYGGAAKARPGSEALLMYLKKNIDAEPVLPRWMGPRLGTHSGATTSNASAFIRREEAGEERPYVAWLLIAARGHHYDVKNFTVVLNYTTLHDRNDASARRAGRPKVELG